MALPHIPEAPHTTLPPSLLLRCCTCCKVYNDAGGGPRGEEKAVRKLITGKWRKKFRISDSMNFSQMYYAVTPLGNALALSNR